MKSQLIMASFLAVTSPALAAEYYVVRNLKLNECKVDIQKPDGTTKVTIGTTTYGTYAEAKAAIAIIPECKTPKDAPAVPQ